MNHKPRKLFFNSTVAMALFKVKTDYLFKYISLSMFMQTYLNLLKKKEHKEIRINIKNTGKLIDLFT